MASFTLHQIDCYRINDWDEKDELRIEIFPDDQRKQVLRYSIAAGESWKMNKTVVYKKSAIIKIWEDGGTKNTLLSRFVLKANQKAATKEQAVKKGKAHYILKYTIGEMTKARTSGISGTIKRKAAAEKNLPLTMSIKPGDFDPDTHGFSFRNSFKVRISLGFNFLPKIASRYGLCGGMSRLAADSFFHNQNIPDLPKTPRIGSALYKYLLDRQLDTFGRGFQYLAKFFQWWALLSDEMVEKRTAVEFGKMRKVMKKEKTVLLGLVYVKYKTGGIWDNHQVLAYDYEQMSDKVAFVRIYDPNYPKRKDVYLRLQLEKVKGLRGYSMKMICTQHVGSLMARPVRGFFVIPIPPKEVPEDVVRRVGRSRKALKS